MYYLTIDTCVWINILKNDPKIIKKLRYLADKGKVTLLLPEILVDEWNFIKSKTEQEMRRSVSDRLKNAKSLGGIIDDSDYEEFKQAINYLEKMADQNNDSITQLIKSVDHLINHSSTIIIPIEENAKLEAVEFALQKKRPFRNKNSMADALILLCAVNYIKSKNIKNCLFVTINSNDFAGEQIDIVHEDLKEVFERAGLEFISNIGKAINRIEKGLIKQDRIENMEENLRGIAAIRKLGEEIARRYKPLIITAEMLQPFDMSGLHIMASDFAKIIENQKAITDSFKASDFLEYMSAFYSGIPVISSEETNEDENNDEEKIED